MPEIQTQPKGGEHRCNIGRVEKKNFWRKLHKLAKYNSDTGSGNKHSFRFFFCKLYCFVRYKNTTEIVLKKCVYSTERILFRTVQSNIPTHSLPLRQFSVDFQPKKVKSVNIQYLFSKISV